MDRNCRACGTPHDISARFCTKCGMALASDAQSNPVTDATVGEDNGWVELAGGTATPPPPVSPPPSPMAPPSTAEVEPECAVPLDVETHVARGEYRDADVGGMVGVDAAAMPPPPPPPRQRRTGRALWIIAIILGLFVAGLIVAWTVSWTRGPSFSTVAASADDPASPDEEWRTAYADQFIGDVPVTMITNASANVRDYPTTAGSQVLRSVAESSEISGRWVRGRDQATRWLKLADGGYIWDGNLAERGGANSPIRIPFSNADYSFGPDIEPYMRDAAEQSTVRSEAVGGLPEKERAAAYAELEGQSFYARVPNRRWRGLTVTAVAQHYEAGSIYFRDDVAATRRAFAAAGVRFDEEGIVDPDNNDLLSCSIGPVRAEDRAYGASALTCGS